jgi:hypothetical protein
MGPVAANHSELSGTCSFKPWYGRLRQVEPLSEVSLYFRNGGNCHGNAMAVAG